MARVLKWMGIGLGALLGVPVLTIVLVLLFFDLNPLRGLISRAVSTALERDFSIDGDLRADWSWTPR